MRFPISPQARSVLSTLIVYLVLLWLGRSALIGLWSPDAYYPALMYDSGVCSVWLLIATLCVTPILMAISRLGWGRTIGRWLLRQRRHLGLASAYYAGLHLWYYVAHEASLDAVLFDLVRLEYAVGWISLALLAVLAMTSHQSAVRRLGRRWKPLHRLIYPAAALALWHWFLLDWYAARPLFWSAVLLAPLAVRPILHRIPRPAQA